GFDVGADLVEVERPREVVAGGEVAANLVGRHRGDDGPGGDVGLELCDETVELRERHGRAHPRTPNALSPSAETRSSSARASERQPSLPRRSRNTQMSAEALGEPAP